MLKVTWQSYEREHIVPYLKQALSRANRYPETRNSYGILDLLSGRETRVTSRSHPPSQNAASSETIEHIHPSDDEIGLSSSTSLNIKDAARKIRTDDDVQRFLQSVNDSGPPTEPAAMRRSGSQPESLNVDSGSNSATMASGLSLAARLGPLPTSPSKARMDPLRDQLDSTEPMRSNMSLAERLDAIPHDPAVANKQQPSAFHAIGNPAAFSSLSPSNSAHSLGNMAARGSITLGVDGPKTRGATTPMFEAKPSTAAPRALSAGSSKGDGSLHDDFGMPGQRVASPAAASSDREHNGNTYANRIAELENLLSSERELRIQAENSRDDAHRLLQRTSLSTDTADDKVPSDILQLQEQLTAERERHLRSENSLVISREEVLAKYRQAEQKLKKALEDVAEAQKLAEQERERCRDIERRVLAEKRRNEEADVERLAARRILADLEDEFSHAEHESGIVTFLVNATQVHVPAQEQARPQGEAQVPPRDASQL